MNSDQAGIKPRAVRASQRESGQR